MGTTIQIAKHNLSVSLHPAMVIHADKYTEARGGWGNLPVSSILHTDLVFRSKQENVDWPIHLTGYDMPVYNNQDVIVIAVDDAIIGFVDTQTDLYYYTDTNFSRNFNIGMRRYKAWLIGFIGSVIAYFLIADPINIILCIIPLVLMLIFYHVQKAIWNSRIKNALDGFLSNR
ncbi:MAG: hypothetical protein ABI581_13390 [Sediminibacterium sp.]